MSVAFWTGCAFVATGMLGALLLGFSLAKSAHQADALAERHHQ